MVAGAVSLSLAAIAGAGGAITPDLAKIHDARSWSLLNGEAVVEKEAGTSVLRLRPKGDIAVGSNVGLALVARLELGAGTFEVDLKGAGAEAASFLGIAFDVADERNFEAVYFRPFNFTRAGERDGQPFRAHAVQYVAWPANPWERLRKDRPLVYESTVRPTPDAAGWFHARVEVTRRKVSVWVDGSKEPCLVVDRLGTREKGRVGLWVDSKEGAFRNLRITTARAAP